MTKFIAWGQKVVRSDMQQPPGNSLPLIDAAYEHGYDGIELDVRITKDGHLVLMHDGTIDKTTESVGAVKNMTVEELSQVRLKDPWGYEPCYVETLVKALKHNGDRGLIMIDLRGLNDVSLDALHRAVDEAGFDEKLLLLLAYNRDDGLVYMREFPQALVMLKAPAGMKPPELTPEFLSQADGIPCVIVPIANDMEQVALFKAEAVRLGLKIGVYIHTRGLASVLDLMRADVDFVTSMSPAFFAEGRRKFAEERAG